jgi:MFS family permease
MTTKHRNRVLALLCVLFVITYLDRVCISVAGPRMQAALTISPAAWGWVTGIFTLSYALFEIPSGVLGDRIGPRRVLTRIVIWWSVFTSLTGFVSGFYPLLLTRFLFGAGEAGAYPNAAVVVSRWFPAHERGRAFGICLMASQVGGALSPLLVVPIQAHFGWRASFYVFGILGLAWAAAWYRWFRDSPAEEAGAGVAGRAMSAAVPRQLPWGSALKSGNFWAALAVAFCYVYTYNFFQSWLHTYLVKARGFSEQNLLLSSMPYIVAAFANCAGGLLNNVLVRRIGLKWGRCSIGVVSLGLAALCAAAVMFTDSPAVALILLSLTYGGITFQQPIMFAVCLDIGGPFAGAIAGSMNTAAQVGSLISSLAFGYIVERSGSYDLPFVPMALLLAAGALLWLKIDPTRALARDGAPPYR